MLEKIKTLHKHPFLQEFRDVRLLGLIVFGVIVLMVCWSGVRVIETNYRLEQQIARMEEQSKLRHLENTNKKLKNEYYKSDQYLELQARRSFGKAAAGETLLLVPEEVALAHTVDLPEETLTETEVAETQKPLYQRNFEAWMNFFFRRNTSEG
jgi:cell division protein FtsB